MNHKDIGPSGLSPEFIEKEKQVSALLVRALIATINRDLRTLHQVLQEVSEIEYQLSRELEARLTEEPWLLPRYLSHVLSAAYCFADNEAKLDLAVQLCNKIRNYANQRPELYEEVGRLQEHIDKRLSARPLVPGVQHAPIKRRALLIGVPSYLRNTIRNLPIVHQDVRNLEESLKKSGYAVYSVCSDDIANTSRSSILRSLRKACLQAEEGETLILYFSGHGLHFQGIDYLVPSDAVSDDPGALREYLVSTNLSDVIDQSKADTVILFVDACREGLNLGIEEEKKGLVLTDWTRGQREKAKRRRFVVVFGCGPGQYCQFVDGQDGFSLFSRALADVLDPRHPAQTLEHVIHAAKSKLRELVHQHKKQDQEIRHLVETSLDDDVLQRVICEGTEPTAITLEETIRASYPFIPPRVSIFTQLVIDNIIHVKVPHEAATLKRAMRWDTVGNIIIKPGAQISVPHMSPKAQRLLFTLKPGSYRSGEKIGAESTKAVKWNGDNSAGGQIARFGYVRQTLGGGGINVGYALYNLFRGVEAELHAVYTKIPDDAITCALAPIFRGGLQLDMVNPGPSVNLVIEGIANDNLVIKSPQPLDIQIDPHQSRPNSLIMVNSNYNVYSSVDGLLELVNSQRGGLVACTMSLCNKNTLPRTVQRNVEQRLTRQMGAGNAPKFKSVLDFIRDFVMPQSDNIVYVFNETELDNIAFESGEDTLFRIPDGAVLFGKVIDGLRRLRAYQRGKHPFMFVTLGADGVICLDSQDSLHYCRVARSEEVQRAPREKNAMGSLFAGTILGLYACGAYEREAPILRDGATIAESSLPRILISACAACDCGVYDGFSEVDPPGVDRMISLKIAREHYAYLGRIEKFRRSHVAGADVSYVSANLIQYDGSNIDGLLEGRVTGGFGLATLVDRRYLTYPEP